MPKPIPDGFHTVTPYLVVKGAADAIDFYKKAFGAKELKRAVDERDGRLMNAQIMIGNSIVMLNDEYPEHGSRAPSGEAKPPASMHIYVENVDTFFDKAVKAGAEVTMPVMDAFWGDRFGAVKDPFGHHWSISTHTQDLTPQQIAEAARKAFSEAPC